MTVLSVRSALPDVSGQVVHTQEHVIKQYNLVVWSKAVIPCGCREGGCQSGVALAMHHGLSGISTNGLTQRDVYGILTFFYQNYRKIIEIVILRYPCSRIFVSKISRSINLHACS